MNNGTIDICMLTCNRARITVQAITELHRRTTTPHRLIVLDNGSEDETPIALARLQMAGMIHRLEFSNENYGVHWGHNQLLEMAESSLYISADNDLIPQSLIDGEDWLAKLVRLMEARPDYAAIACRPHILIGQHGSLFDGAPEVKEMSHVGAHLRLMRAEAVREVGGWRDHQNPGRNDEEKWICGRLRTAGWKVGYARDVRCIHLFGDLTKNEDDWGYPATSDHKARGHRDMWPMPATFQWDRVGIDWESCK